MLLFDKSLCLGNISLYEENKEIIFPVTFKILIKKVIFKNGSNNFNAQFIELDREQGNILHPLKIVLGMTSFNAILFHRMQPQPPPVLSDNSLRW